MSAYLIDRRFFRAAVWSTLGAGLTAVGLMHAYQISGNAVGFYFIFADPPAEGAGLAFGALRIAIGYLLAGAVFLAFGVYHQRRGDAIVGPGH